MTKNGIPRAWTLPAIAVVIAYLTLVIEHLIVGIAYILIVIEYLIVGIE